MSEAELIQQLSELAKQYPERFEQAKKDHPEWWEVIANIPREVELLALCKQDNPQGYYAFYEGINGFPPPPQIKKWVAEIYGAHDDGLGFTLNGYRGSWKSVSLSAHFTAWRIGNEPGKTNLILSANDDNTDKVTKNIAQVIEFNPFWKKAFPDVVPDGGRWSVNGYWVIDSSVPRERWAEKQSGVIDPTFLGGGYTSTRINGKHPTGVLIIDDIHGINNSTSETERKFIVKFGTTELMKTVVSENDKLDTWVLNIGVPWGNDLHQALSKSGGFRSSVLPVMKKVDEEDEGAVYIDGINKITGVEYEDIKGWWRLQWPEKFGVSRIKQDRGLGKFDFWQMMMMDLTLAKTGTLRFYDFPARDVDKTWPTAGGIDVPYEFKERHEHETKLSSFAMAFLSKNPRGGAVVVGGVLEHPTIGRAFRHILEAQTGYVNWIMALCEDVGGGRVFREAAKLMYPQMNIIGSDLGRIIRRQGEGGGKAKDKKTRIQLELAPWLESGTIRISEERSPYLDALRDGLENFGELDANKADDRLDALDALYHAAKGMPEVLVGSYDAELPPLFKKRQESPLAGRLALRRKHG